MSTSPSSSPRRSIPPLVLLSFAVLHSQVYWLYSIIYHLCNNLSDRPLDLSLDDKVFQALTKRSGRARAFSEPQQTSSGMLQQRQTLSNSIITTRPRSSTISAATVDADIPLQRQQWVQQLHEQQQQLVLDDERLGRTRPPRWWQRTRQHLTRHDDIETTSTLYINHDHLTNSPQQLQRDHDISIDDLSSTTTLRPFAKVRSILTKSPIEPEYLKRKTILGIRWSIQAKNSSRIKDTTSLSPPLMESKRRLFSSLPAWKRKSVG